MPGHTELSVCFGIFDSIKTHNGKAHVHIFEKRKKIRGQPDLKKREPVQYTVEREFLAKFSVEELVIRIIRAHRNPKSEKENLKK